MLNSNSGKSFFLICAAAGYGKTVLLADTFSGNRRVSWLQGDSMIDSILTLFEYLTEAIKQSYPSFGTAMLEFISASADSWKETESEINDIVIIFINELTENIHEEIVLVIDDYHLICAHKNEMLNAAISMLLKYQPANLKVIISTREAPGLEIMRLKAKRKCVEFETTELAFTTDEITELSKSLYDSELSRIEAEKLKDKTSGWITGIHLLYQSKSKFTISESNEKDIFDFFAEDIYSKLEPVFQNFVLFSSLLDSFSPEDTDKLLGISTSTQIIDQLTKRNIFIESFESFSKFSYSYQKLFSAFLNSTIEKKLDEVTLVAAYRRASLIYNEKKEVVRAIECAIKAKDYVLSLEFINNSFELYFENGENQVLRKCFDSIGWDIIQSNEVALINFMKFSLSSNSLFDVEKCINIVEETGDILISNTLDEDYLLCKSEYFLLKTNYEDSIATLEGIIELNPKTLSRDRTTILLAKNYYRMGFDYYEKAIILANELLSSNKDLDRTIKIELLKILGNIYSDRGDKLTTIKFYEQTLELEKSVIKTFKTRSNLSDFYSHAGRYEKAYSYLSRANEMFEKYPSALFERIYLRSLFNFQSNIGDYISAIDTLARVESNEELSNNVPLLFAHWVALCEVYYRVDDKIMSKQALNMLKNNELKDIEFYKLLYEFCENFYSSEIITTTETEIALNNILTFYKERNVYLVIPLVEFHFSEHYLLRENYETALSYLAKSLESLRTKQFIAFAQQQYVLSRHVYDLAVSQNIEKKFIRDIHLSLIEKVDLPFIDDEFRKKLLKDIDKITDIKFSSFGKTEFYLRGELVHEDKWIRKKSKILLAYLMSDPEKVHTKDKVMDMFFDDMPVDKADVVYHSTIYNIRTALKVYELKSDKPKRSKSKSYDYNPQYILYEDKTLRLNPDFYYTSDNIEFERHYEKAKLPSLSTEEKIKHSVKAVELYKGDFLPGYYESWSEELREKYKNMYITLTEDLIKLLESEKRYEEVVKYSEMLLNEDKLNDAAHVSIVKAYSALGNINMAKSRFQVMLKIFEEELGEKPSQKTLDKIKSVLE
ncbi:MAG: hypothetical protein K8I03_08130 [Ignavibacteria bacterium]|nr:hypothetical protein [Ignavibacteria bacterium]